MAETLLPQHTAHRYQQLDSLRGLAALCVFLSHYLLAFKTDIHLTAVLKETPLGVLVNGRAAVMFFFVLSGFVLTLPFVNKERPLKVIAFYIKRIFRIYPAYLLAIAFALLLKTYLYHPMGLQPFSGWIKGFWMWGLNSKSYQELLKTGLMIGPNFNNDFIDPVIWSLVVEMKMSFLLPFLIILVARNKLVFNLVLFVVILVVTYNHQTGFLGVFYLGILLAKYKTYLISKLSKANLAAIIALTLLAVFLYNISFEFFKPWGDRAHLFAYFWRDYLTAIGSCIIIIIPLSRNRVSAFLKAKPFLFLGDISYSFYLLHLPIIITICSLFASASVLSDELIFVSTLSLAFILSYFSFKYIEIPFQSFSKKLTAKWTFLKW
jgi:peptidoglycan/LPS O-acetylase OafA/YrhL